MHGVCSGLLAFVLLIEGAAAEMTLQEEDPPGGPFKRVNVKYDRFTARTAKENEQLFLGGTHDWSGVGREVEARGKPVSDQSRWGTLISGSFFVTANHFRPRVGKHLIFYRENDPADFESRRINQAFRLDRGDLYEGPNRTRDAALGMLSQPVSGNIATYPICVRKSYLAMELLTFGISGSDKSIPTGQKLGWRWIWGTAESHRVAEFKYFPNSVTPLPGGQAVPRTHDSGAPTFVVKGLTKPALLGTHWTGLPGTAGDGPDSRTADGSTDSIFAWYQAWIERRLDDAQASMAKAVRERAIFITETSGDFDGDFARDQDDIDILLREIRARSVGINRGYNWALDVDNSGKIDRADALQWLALAGSSFGDADLDGDVDALDQGVVLRHRGKENAGWQNGDFTGDGRVNQSDLRLLRRNLSRD